MRKIRTLILLIFLGGCSGSSADKPDFFGFAAGENLAELKNKKIREASGLAASFTNPGYLWTHNDSGNDARVFLIDEKLKIKLTCKLVGAENRDWEDITVGPGPDSTKTYVYVGDIGDNLARFDYKIIYRFEEPVFKIGEGEIDITNFQRIVFKLPDERKDAETLMINPHTRDLFVVSKREQPVVIYRLSYPHNITDTLTAETIASIDLTEIVAGDFSKDGSEILLKNSKNVYYWKVGGKSLEEVFRSKPQILSYDKEPQGEAITFAHDGSGYYTISEKISGEKSYLKFYKRK
jgi:hypothetical protein